MTEFPSLFIPTVERTANEFAADLTRRGHVIMTYEGRLFVSEASKLTQNDRQDIKTHRTALLALARPLAGDPTPLLNPKATIPQVSLGDYLGITSVPTLPKWVRQDPPPLAGINDIVLNFETNGLEWWKGDAPIGVTIGTLDGQLHRYLPFAHPGSDNFDRDAIIQYLQTEVRGKNITNANTKFDVHMGRNINVDFEAQGCTVSDVQHYAALLDDNRKKFALDILARDYLGGSEIGRLDERNMSQYHAYEAGPRAEYQAILVAQLREKMWPLLEKEDLHRVRALEDQVIYPTVEMERNAMPVDRALLKQWSAEIEQLQHECLWEIAREVGFSVNPDSPADMVRLFQRFNLPIEYTESERPQPSFTDKILKGIDNKYVQLARKAGKLASLNAKFFKAYDAVVGDDCLLRYHLHQLRVDDKGTVRGRYSSSDKNIQQVMNRDTHMESFGSEDFFVRRIFVGANGSILAADAAQIEYRIFAHHSKSERILARYREDPNVSFHRIAEAMIKPYRADLPYTKVKSCNFLFVYGGGKTHLGEYLEVPKAEADQLYELYHRAFPEVKQVLREAENTAKTRGYVRSILGRRARFPDPKYAYKAWNAVAQPTAADIFKTKIVELHRERKHTGLLMRAPVHDEIVGDPQLPETAERVSEILNTQSFELRVPILWNVKVGKNWAEAK